MKLLKTEMMPAKFVRSRLISIELLNSFSKVSAPYSKFLSLNGRSGDEEIRDESGRDADSSSSIDTVNGHEEDEWEMRSSGSAEKLLYLGKGTEKVES